MSTLAYINISKMFTSIRESRSIGSNYLDDKIHAHCCTGCGQVFLARFDYISGMGWLKWAGDHFYCPGCGKLQIENYLAVSREGDTCGEWLPISLRVILQEFQKHLKLSIKGDCIRFSDDGMYIDKDTISEEIVFDIKGRKVIFKPGRGTPEELGNPFWAVTFLQKSLLRFIVPESAMYQNHKKEVSALLKTLRERISKKMKEIHGITLNAMSIHPGKRYGLLLLPIVNLAWRIACPDAKNLPLYEISGCKDSENYGYHLNECMERNGNLPRRLIDDVMNLTRSGISYPQSVAKAYGLPDTKGLRKLISEQSIFSVGTIKIGFEMMRDYKYKLLAAKQALALNKSYRDMREKEPKALSKFIKPIAGRFGDKIAARLLLDFDKLQVADTMLMYFKLTRDNRKMFMRTSLTAERMHDWLIDVLDTQEHQDYGLNQSEEFIKRVEMRMGLNKFFVPKTAHELRCAGKKLRNCVGSYAEKVLTRKTNIVLVSDKKGDLKVCIEIRNNKIEQAKLFANARVSEDETLNSQVKIWAKKLNFKIGTRDIDISECNEETPLIAV